MLFSKILPLLISVVSVSSLVIPRVLFSNPVKRAFGDEENPIPIWLNVDATWAHVAEDDCYAILCLGAPRFGSRDSGASGKRRTAGGVAIQPFQGSQEEMEARGVFRPASHPDWTSAEESVFASSSLGGVGTILFPAHPSEQGVQGNVLRRALDRGNVGTSEWYTQNWTGNLGLYCSALMAVPPDTSVCPEHPKDDDNDPSGFAFVRISEKGKRIKFAQVLPGYKWKQSYSR